MSPDSPSTSDSSSDSASDLASAAGGESLGTAPERSSRVTARSDDSRSSLVNALIGGAVGVVLSFVPLSTVVGGGVAGYLEGGETEDGLRVGVLAGVIMALPLALFGLLASLFVFGVGAPISVGGLFLVALLFITVYTVGLGALGGVLGAYLEGEL